MVAVHGQIQAATTMTNTNNQNQSGRVCLLQSTKQFANQAHPSRSLGVETNQHIAGTIYFQK